MTHRKLIIAATIAAIPLGLAVAQTSGPSGQNSQGDRMSSQRSNAAFEKLDKNRDGRISKSEASADSTITWSSADANGDGYLDSREWSSSRGAANPGNSSQGQSSQGQSGNTPSNPPADPSNTGTNSSGSSGGGSSSGGSTSGGGSSGSGSGSSGSGSGSGGGG
jgi:hypothetical protein